MIKVRVEKIVDEAQGIRSFLLAGADGQPLPPYDPGAHVDVTVPGGITRQYSLCSHPSKAGAYQIAVKREAQSRGGSKALHDLVQEGSELTISSPRNLFPLDTGRSDYVLMAAGIGVTPLLSMAYRLLELGKPFHLHYFARSRDFAAFADLLASPTFADKVTFHYGVEPPALAERLAQCLDARPEAAVYTCGPAAFMDQVVAVAAKTRDKHLIHLEHFAATDHSAEPSQAFDVVLKRSGRTVHVDSGVALSEALVKSGCTVHTSCKEGVCGTCIIPVVGGQPDHRDNCLTDDEKAAGDLICACVSRCHGTLVLDL